MSKLLSLSDVSPGDTARILCINSEGSIRRRLLDIGFTENSTVKCVGVSPLGDPMAFLVRGAVIAIRRCDLEDILIYCDKGGF